ncbi:MAG: efflux RND transporter periplasmic adaptor subunit [Candidatus Sulfobium sp.]
MLPNKLNAIPIVALTLAILLGGCKGKVEPGTAEVKRQRVSGVKVETIRPAEVDKYYETSGTVIADSVSVISSRIMGTITSMKVKEGDKVRAGQLLLTVDNRDIQQKVKAAKESYEEAKKGLEAAKENRDLVNITYRRYKNLYDEKALTGQELDQIRTKKKVADIELARAKAGVRRAEAGLGEAEVNQGFGRVTAPTAGIVTNKNADAGSMAVPGNPLMNIEDNSSYRLEIKGNESLSGRITAGMEADIFIGALDRHFRGRVVEVVPSVNPASRSFVVKIHLSGEGLRSGFYGRVSIAVGKKEVLLVPAGAVVERGELTGLYTVGNDNVIKYTLIRVGKTFGGKVEVLSGLEPDDRVIVEGIDRAVDGGLYVGEVKSPGNTTEKAGNPFSMEFMADGE